MLVFVLDRALWSLFHCGLLFALDPEQSRGLSVSCSQTSGHSHHCWSLLYCRRRIAQRRHGHNEESKRASRSLASRSFRWSVSRKKWFILFFRIPSWVIGRVSDRTFLREPGSSLTNAYSWTGRAWKPLKGTPVPSLWEGITPPCQAGAVQRVKGGKSICTCLFFSQIAKETRLESFSCLSAKYCTSKFSTSKLVLTQCGRKVEGSKITVPINLVKSAA